MNSNAQTQNTLSLVIGDFTVLQDEEGRYSLNDIQRAAIAAGVTKDIRPNKWLALEQTQALIALLITQNCVINPINVVTGRYGGTYGVRELVYSYSMWISPEVNLNVIRGFDAMVMSGKGQNLSVGISITAWARLVSMGTSLMKSLALCTDMGVAQGQFGTLLQVNRVCGIATPPLERLAPGLRQQLLALDAYDKAEGSAS